MTQRGDIIVTKELTVTIQENGIIRAPDGYLIGRLTDEIEFDSEHLIQELPKENNMEVVSIYKWQLEDIIDVFRLTANIFKVRDKESCYGRDFRQAELFAKNALNGEKDKQVRRL